MERPPDETSTTDDDLAAEGSAEAEVLTTPPDEPEGPAEEDSADVVIAPEAPEDDPSLGGEESESAGLEASTPSWETSSGGEGTTGAVAGVDELTVADEPAAADEVEPAGAADTDEDDLGVEVSQTAPVDVEPGAAEEGEPEPAVEAVPEPQMESPVEEGEFAVAQVEEPAQEPELAVAEQTEPPAEERQPDIAEEPAAEQGTVAEEPVAEEPIAEEPVAEVPEPVAEEPVAEEPVAEVPEPVTEEPVAEPAEPVAAAAAPAEPEEVEDREDLEEVAATDGRGRADPFRGPGEWYVVHTYAGYENKVKANLMSRIHSMQMEDKIFDVHIPMEDVMEIKGGKKQVVQRKVFPGYLLVKMVYDNDSWYVVRNTPGVTGFVSSGTGTKPTPLSKREVEKILAVRQEEVKPTFRLEFEEGDTVRIISGPFADFNGTISEINVDQSKLKVLVNIFDRETPVELGFDQVARV